MSTWYQYKKISLSDTQKRKFECQIERFFYIGKIDPQNDEKTGAFFQNEYQMTEKIPIDTRRPFCSPPLYFREVLGKRHWLSNFIAK